MNRCKIVLLKGLLQKVNDVGVSKSSSNVFEQKLIELIGDLGLGNHAYTIMDEIEKTFRFRLTPDAATKNTIACVTTSQPRPKSTTDHPIQVTLPVRKCGTIVGTLNIVMLVFFHLPHLYDNHFCSFF